MFGYVTIDKPELKIKDFDVYRSFYCGLCRELRENHGLSGQISLTYDMTFVVMLLSGLYEPPTRKGTTRCIVHPVFRQPVRKNSATEYGADMNVLLTYYKCIDDWKDERKLLRRGYAGLLGGSLKRVTERYPEKARKIRDRLEELSAIEKSRSMDPDLAAGCFGRLMEEIFAWKQDEWTESLRRMGFFLGKFIYLLDAFEDVEKDKKTGNYNVFSEMSEKDGFREEALQLLTMMLSEACREFEHLPVIRYADILRNILYSGVWSRYRRMLQREQTGDRK